MSEHEEGFGSKTVIALAIALGIVAVVVMAVYEDRSAKTVDGGSSAPTFEIDKLGGGKIALADLKGKVVVAVCSGGNVDAAMMQRALTQGHGLI